MLQPATAFAGAGALCGKSSGKLATGNGRPLIFIATAIAIAVAVAIKTLFNFSNGGTNF